ncbi:MAG: SH3 domain-containing protein [Hyphomicrobiales bacterium]
MQGSGERRLRSAPRSGLYHQARRARHQADPQAAAAWYERATALGVIDRTLALAVLESEWTRGDGPPVDTTIVPPEEAAPAPVQPPQATPVEEDKPGPIGRLMAAATELTSGDEWLKTVSAVNMRADASSTSETRKIVQKGLRVRVMSRKGNWVQVTDPATDDEGWIYARFLEPD